MAEARKVIRLKIYPHVHTHRHSDTDTHTHTNTHTHTHSLATRKKGSSAGLLCYLSPAQALCRSRDRILIWFISEVGSCPADEPNP